MPAFVSSPYLAEEQAASIATSDASPCSPFSAFFWLLLWHHHMLWCVCQVRYGISKKTTLNLIAVVVECSRAINFSSSLMNKNAVALLTLGKYVFGVTCQFTFNSNNLALIHNKNHMKGIFLYHHEGHFPSKIS